MYNGNSARKLKAQTPNTESFLRREKSPDAVNVKIDEMFDSANDTISINILPTNRIDMKNQKLAEIPTETITPSDIKAKIKNSLSKRLSMVRDHR